MNHIEIEVIDKDGWKKTFSIQKNLFHIGSSAANDVVLEAGRGTGVSTRHAQLIALPDGSGYRLVNLGDAGIVAHGRDEKAIAPRSVASVTDGSVLKIGDFTLIFHADAPAARAATTTRPDTNIGLRLLLADVRLAPHQSRSGTLVVSNHGPQSGVQFELTLEGLDDDCFHLEPAPLLSSGSEAQVGFRFYHRGNAPLAGERPVTIRATAPRAYPGEEATVGCTLQVQPYFRHCLMPAASVAPPAPVPAMPPVQAIATVHPPTPVPPTPEPVRETVPVIADVPAPAPPEPVQPEPLVEIEPAIAAPEPAKSEADRLWARLEVPPIGDALPTEEPSPKPETECIEDIVPEPEPPVEEEWWPETRTEPAAESAKPEVLVLKATPPPKIEVAPGTTGTAEVAVDDWWSEPDGTTSAKG